MADTWSILFAFLASIVAQTTLTLSFFFIPPPEDFFQRQALRYFFFFFLCITGAFLAFLLRYAISTVEVSAILTNILYYTGFWLMYRACRLRTGQPPSLREMALLTTGLMAAFLVVLYFTFILPMFLPRALAGIITFNLVIGTVLVQRHRGGAHRTRGDWLFSASLLTTLVILAGLVLMTVGFRSLPNLLALHIGSLAASILIFAGVFAMYSYDLIDLNYRRSITDSMTGAYNRRHFFDQLDRQPGPEPRAVILCDIDRFKTINDTLGHEAGDRVIVAFVHRLAAGLRPQDLLVRFGGEEFVLYLPGRTLAMAQAAAEAIRTSLPANSPDAAGDLPSFAASFGVTLWAAGESVDAALKRADDALYAAKQGGRNRVVTADPLVRDMLP